MFCPDHLPWGQQQSDSSRPVCILFPESESVSLKIRKGKDMAPVLEPPGEPALPTA